MQTDTISRPPVSERKTLGRIPAYIDNTAEENNGRRIIAVCQHFSYRPLEELTCLHIGAAEGVMTEYLAKNFKKVIAADINAHDLRLGKHLRPVGNIERICTDGTNLGLSDVSIDVIICDHIHEKISQQKAFMAEIYRILRYDGFCYFGAFNKYSIVEQNHRLPFLSWFPRVIAELYMKLAGRKGRYYSRLVSLSNLKDLTDNFWRQDYTSLIRRNPKAFLSDDIYRPNSPVARFPKRLFKYIYPFLKDWIWILTKRR